MLKQYQYVSKLPSNIKAALIRYTGPYVYYDLNRRLRNDIPLTPTQLDLIKKMDWAFDHAPPLIQPLTVYRGIDAEAFELEMTSYISTTRKLSVATSGAFIGEHCCLLKILLPPGSKILALRDISEFPLEDEILLPRDGEFKIVKNYVQGKVEVYELQFIPEEVVKVPVQPKARPILPKFQPKFQPKPYPIWKYPFIL